MGRSRRFIAQRRRAVLRGIARGYAGHGLIKHFGGMIVFQVMEHVVQVIVQLFAFMFVKMPVVMIV